MKKYLNRLSLIAQGVTAQEHVERSELEGYAHVSQAQNPLIRGLSSHG